MEKLYTQLYLVLLASGPDGHLIRHQVFFLYSEMSQKDGAP